MCLWVESVTVGGVILTDSLIKEKARFFANAFNIQEDELVFSNGWLDSFKRRNNIRRYRIHGESGRRLLHHAVSNSPKSFDRRSCDPRVEPRG